MTACLAVWDVDGTLVDSRAIIFECCRYALVQLGFVEPTYDEVRQIVGLSLEPALAILAPGLDADQVVRAAEAYKDRFREHRRTPGFVEPLYEGALETLHRLNAEGWVMAIATGKSRAGVDSIVALNGWQDLFVSTHCADDGPGKPHPSMVLEAMKASGFKPEHTIMIGDTSHDMRMAKAAGVRAQGVSWGFHTTAEMQVAGADHVADDFICLNNQLSVFSQGVGRA